MRAIINVLMRGQILYLHMCKAWLLHECSHEEKEFPLPHVSGEEKRMFSLANMSPIYGLFTKYEPVLTIGLLSEFAKT